VEHPRHPPVLTTLVAALAICLAVAGCAARSAPADVPGERAAEKNFILPVVEIIAMDAAINLAGRQMYDPAEYNVTPKTIGRNLRQPWVVEDDPFEINQFLHPYQGAMYHDIARSSGMNYWQAAAYTFAGSAMWEIAGETTRPSKNDQIASGIAGSFLGEPLFRTARLLLDRRDGKPGVLRTLAATLVSPPTGFNRALVGDRYDPARREALPAADIRLQLGVTAPLGRQGPAASKLQWRDQFVGFSVDYGFPGKTEYAHAKPFDYFRLDGVASREGLDSLSTRGILAGKDYRSGDASRGVWGLYGSYDYFAPDVFRVSSTALSLGTTMQSLLSNSVTLQTSGLAGVGYTASQSLLASGDRDYHYGVAPQALAAARLIAGSRAAMDITTRGYYVSDLAGFGTGQHDFIHRTDASLALRVYGHHGLAVKYLFSRRAATHPGLPQLIQKRATVGLFYTFLGSKGFGAIR
jgi:hypothetical protein